MIDPEAARSVLREYHATASDEQIADDLRRFSPELARRLDLGDATERPSPRRGVRGIFASVGRSVLRLFS